MGLTKFTGLAVGHIIEASGASGGRNVDVGYPKLVQTQIINFDADLTQEAIFYLPANAAIRGIVVDVLTAYDSATSATLTVGSASAGTQYAGSVNAKTAGRVLPTFSAAQLAAMDDIDTNYAVYATITSVGQPTAGQVRVDIEYIVTE